MVTDFIGKEPGYMTWQQVRQMQESGLVQFGSHTLDHARCAACRRKTFCAS